MLCKNLKYWRNSLPLHQPNPAGEKGIPQREISGLVQNRVTVWAGGSGKAAGFAQALPMA
jgi:hypothetical protein